MLSFGLNILIKDQKRIHAARTFTYASGKKKKKEIQINCINEELMLGYTQAQQSQVWREKLYEQICFQ